MGSVVEHETIRTFDLVSAPALDDRAVQELAQSLREAAVSASEALGGVTRRESALDLGDTLEPVPRADVAELAGASFHVIDPLDSGAVIGLLHLDDEQAVGLADLFLGGPGRGVDRRLTSIETKAILQLMGEVLAPLVGAATYRSQGPVALVEANDVSGLEEHLVRLAITLAVGAESVEAALYVADPDKSGVSGGAEARKLVTASVATMPIELDIDLAAVNMPASDIRSLATGDVVVFDVPTSAPVVARHGRHDLLEGRVNESSGRRLFEVTKIHSA